MFKIKKIEEVDCEIISNMIQEYFSYLDLSTEKICEKINNSKFFMIKAFQKNLLVGFAEVEFLETKARLNAIFVPQAWRDQKVATRLLKKCFHECKRKRVHELFLLVKESNSGAKYLYKENGFEFEKMHDKELDNSKVEVWTKKIS